MNKKIVILILSIIYCCSCSNRYGMQNDDSLKTKKENLKSKLYIPESIYDFGQIKSKQNMLVHTFEFTNIGNAPLIIYDADISCSCVAVKFDKQPIQPMKKGKIVVSLNPLKQDGKISKKIFLKSNALNDLEILYIKANVEY